LKTDKIDFTREVLPIPASPLTKTQYPVPFKVFSKKVLATPKIHPFLSAPYIFFTKLNTYYLKIGKTPYAV
jgi:hypothetical protein